MDNVENKNILIKEYVGKYKKVLYWPMRVMGFARFDIKNDKIVNLTSNTLVYRTLLLITGDLCICYLIYTSIVSKNYLKVADGMIILHFAFFSNMLLINMSFVNRHSGLVIIDQSFKIDLLLGHNDTKFMRDVGVKTYLCLSGMVLFTNISGGTFLYRVYDVSMTIHVIGSLYFFWLFFAYDDYWFYLLYITFIGLRARYLNVALAKIGNVHLKYLSNRGPLNILFWKKQHDDIVTFQSKAGLEDYKIAFEMLFEMMRYLEAFFRFPLALAVWTIVMGTFVITQTFIERIKNPNALEQERTYVVIVWAALSWGFLILLTLFLDLFQQQMEQTKLICACVQLKPNQPVAIYKLTKSLLRLLERHEARLSVYNLFYFDTGLILRMGASTLVYITVQLQLAFPNLSITKSNVTTSE